MSTDDRVAEVLGDWYARGASEAPEEVIRRHPDLAEELRAGFASADALDGASVGAPLPAVASSATRQRIGDFELICEIGRGGMGVVFEAEQRSMGRRVALKVLSPGAAPGPKSVERFRREAQAAGRLTHPHVVPVYAMGEENGVWWYAMERVQGTTVAEAIAARRAAGAEAHPAGALATPVATAAAFASVADALEAAHRAGVVHRDMKPSNLILDADGRVRVMDFGLVRVLTEDSRTLPGDLLGTPAYMSPEQARGGGAPVDARTDVYSLGATLYELLALRPPFEGGEVHAVCLRVLTEDPPRLRRLNPAIPRDLATIVETAMERDPDRRYASAAAMAADLRAFAGGRPIAARGAGVFRRLVRRVRRHGVLVALSAGMALAAGAAALVLRQGGSARDAPGVPPSHQIAAGLAAERLRSSRSAAREAAAAWKALPPLAIASSGLGAAVVDGKLYAISGYFTPRVSVYDPEANTWKGAAPLPAPVQYAGTVAFDGRIYVVGGDSGDGVTAFDALRVYDPRADAWTTRAAMPGGARWTAAAAAHEGKIYVVGGVDLDRRHTGRLEVYDVAADRWETKRPMPTPRGPSGGVGFVHGRLYVAGGTVATGPLRVLEVYDPKTDTWETGAPLPQPMATSAAVVDDRLVMVGGSESEDQTSVVAYDPATDAWSSLPPLTLGRHAHGLAYDPARRTLYAVAGYNWGWLSQVEAYVVPPRER